MCISDWSSDVCSSDLMDILAVTRVEFVEDRDQPPGFDIGADMEDCETGYPSPAERKEARRVAVTGAHDRGRRHLDQTLPLAERPSADGAEEGPSDALMASEIVQIGRASCRERVCQYV